MNKLKPNLNIIKRNFSLSSFEFEKKINSNLEEIKEINNKIYTFLQNQEKENIKKRNNRFSIIYYSLWSINFLTWSSVIIKMI